MEDKDLYMLKKVFHCPLVQQAEVEEQYLEALERLVTTGVIGGKTIRAGDAETRVYWTRQHEDLSRNVSAKLVTGTRTPVKKRLNNPGFVSPLVSSPTPLKHPRLNCTPTQQDSPSPQVEGITGSIPETKQQLVQKKKLLEGKLKEREDKLRKLKMIKLYRTKNNVEQLDTLTAKWRLVSQDAAENLLTNSTRDPPPTMTQLLKYLHIDPTLIHYSPQDEAFY